MGTGYTRNDTLNNIADGNIINASDLDGEFDAVESAFNESTGHTHDGTAAEGAPITVLGPVQDFIASATEIKPKTTNTLDIGTASLQFKDMYLDGAAYIGNISVDGNTISSTDTNGNLTIDPNGTGNIVLDANVGIGTASPAEKLQISAGNIAIDDTYGIIFDGDKIEMICDSSDLQIGVRDDVDIYIDTNNNDASQFHTRYEQ